MHVAVLHGRGLNARKHDHARARLHHVLQPLQRAVRHKAELAPALAREFQSAAGPVHKAELWRHLADACVTQWLRRCRKRLCGLRGARGVREHAKHERRGHRTVRVGMLVVNEHRILLHRGLLRPHAAGLAVHLHFEEPPGRRGHRGHLRDSFAERQLQLRGKHFARVHRRREPHRDAHALHAQLLRRHGREVRAQQLPVRVLQQRSAEARPRRERRRAKLHYQPHSEAAARTRVPARRRQHLVERLCGARGRVIVQHPGVAGSRGRCREQECAHVRRQSCAERSVQ
jgi:hypothetical protein